MGQPAKPAVGVWPPQTHPLLHPGRPSRPDLSTRAAGRPAPVPMSPPVANPYPDLPTFLFRTLTAPLTRLTESLVGPANGVRAMAFADNAPSWEALEDLKSSRRTELGVGEPDTAAGPPLARSRKRTFGKSGPIRVKLWRDTAAWCPFCQKVWMVLEEKEIPYVVETVPLGAYGDKPAHFMAIAPKGIVPVMEIDGQVVTESDAIVARLEAEFPEPRLFPAEGTADWDRAAEVKGQEFNKLSLLTLAMRVLPGLPWRDGLRATFEEGLDAVDSELAKTEGPYFLGPHLSYTDINLAPFLDRWVALFAYYKGGRARTSGRWPALSRWFDAMESRPSYTATKCDYYTNARLLSFLGMDSFLFGKDALARQIDGRDGASWSVPLPPLGPGSVEPYAPGEDPPTDRLEAAARLIDNRDAILMFALRGVGKAGKKQFRAPMADPEAEPGLEWRDDVDAALRHVAHALLVGVNQKQASDAALGPVTDGQGLDGSAAVYCAEYLRDRVSVPRDLLLPQARQLRAHLNWLIDELRV